jgi:hypothetical protein
MAKLVVNVLERKWWWALWLLSFLVTAIGIFAEQSLMILAVSGFALLGVACLLVGGGWLLSPQRLEDFNAQMRAQAKQQVERLMPVSTIDFVERDLVYERQEKLEELVEAEIRRYINFARLRSAMPALFVIVIVLIAAVILDAASQRDAAKAAGMIAFMVTVALFFWLFPRSSVALSGVGTSVAGTGMGYSNIQMANVMTKAVSSQPTTTPILTEQITRHRDETLANFAQNFSDGVGQVMEQSERAEKAERLQRSTADESAQSGSPSPEPEP